MVNPYFLKVTFHDGSPSVEKTYAGGASQAVEAVSKAFQYYTGLNKGCEITLNDHRGYRISTLLVEQIKPKRRPRKAESPVIRVKP